MCHESNGIGGTWLYKDAEEVPRMVVKVYIRIWIQIIYSRGRLYIQGADYIFKGPIIYSLIGQFTNWNQIIIQKIKVKTSGLVNAKHLITYSWSWRHSDSTVL